MPVSSQASRWVDGPYAALNVAHLPQRASSARRGSDGLQVRRSGGPRWRTAGRGLPFDMRSACGVACLHHRALGTGRGDGSHRDRPSMLILTDVRTCRGKLDVVGLPFGEAEPMRLPVRVALGVRVAPRHIHPVHAAVHRPGMRPESARVSPLAAGLVRGAPYLRKVEPRRDPLPMRPGIPDAPRDASKVGAITPPLRDAFRLVEAQALVLRSPVSSRRPAERWQSG